MSKEFRIKDYSKTLEQIHMEKLVHFSWTNMVNFTERNMGKLYLHFER
jgi:hypothetical protein